MSKNGSGFGLPSQKVFQEGIRIVSPALSLLERWEQRDSRNSLGVFPYFWIGFGISASGAIPQFPFYKELRVWMPKRCGLYVIGLLLG